MPLPPACGFLAELCQTNDWDKRSAIMVPPIKQMHLVFAPTYCHNSESHIWASASAALPRAGHCRRRSAPPPKRHTTRCAPPSFDAFPPASGSVCPPASRKKNGKNEIAYRRFDLPKQIKYNTAQNNRHKQKIIRQDRAAVELAHQIAYSQQQHRQPKALAVILDCKAFSANQMLICPAVSLHLIESAAHLKPAVSPCNRHLFKPQLCCSLYTQTLIVFDGFCLLGHRTFFIIRQRQGKFVICFICVIRPCRENPS